MVSTLLRTVPKSRLSDDVAWQIELAIKGGQFQPGQKLPSERKLSHDLGVSRPILRQALHNLETRGLVDIQHGRGTYVATLAGEFSPQLHGCMTTTIKLKPFMRHAWP